MAEPQPSKRAAASQSTGQTDSQRRSALAAPGEPQSCATRAGYGTSVARVQAVPAVLLVTSNGSGLGHLARMTALGRALQEQGADPVLASMSAALPLVLEATGLRGEYVPGP